MQGNRSWLLLLAVWVAGAAIAAGGVTGHAGARAARPQRARALEAQLVVARIELLRRETWSWQRLMGVARTPSSSSARRPASLSYKRWALQLWTKRASAARRQASKPARLSAWLCIFRHESAGYGWAVNTGNGYYGGLQMDLEFQRTYGRELLRLNGTADNWTPLEQIWVAERAYRSGRGFSPWPTTARYCGLR